MNGENHNKISNWTIVIGSLGSYCICPEWSFEITVGLVIGRHINPDVRDQSHIRTHGKKSIGFLLGSYIEKFISIIVFPLAWFIGHRSIWSHLPGLGTIFAFYWLLMLSYLFYWCSGFVSHNDIVPISEFISQGFWCCRLIILGWFIQDTAHWIADGCPVEGIFRVKKILKIPLLIRLYA